MSSSLAAPTPHIVDGAAGRLSREVYATNGHVLAAAMGLLVLPNILFAAHLAPLPMVAMLAGCVLSLVLFALRPVAAADSVLAQPLALPRLCATLTIAFVLLLLGGESHLFFANWDWLWRDAVLADLAHSSFPPSYEIGGTTFILRAPLGMYMLPALIAQLSSLGAGHAVLLAQNTLLLGGALYMLATLSGRRAPLIILVFLAFSGLDAVGTVLMALKQGEGLAAFVLPSHIEAWIGLQYSSVITQIFWVPNHALPSYWLVIVAVLCAKREATLAELCLALAASLFWSPFAFIGTLPLAGTLLIKNARAAVVAPRVWLAGGAALCFLPVALYLRIDAGEVPRAFVLFEPFMVSTIGLFLLIEIPHVVVVRRVWSELDPALRGLFLTSISFLVVLPTVRLGLFNDLVMRASIPALMLLAIAFAEALAIAWPERKGIVAAGLALALVGAVTPAMEIARSVSFSSFAESQCNLVTVWHKLRPELPTLENYLASKARLPAGLLRTKIGAPLLDQPNKVCWPDIPFDPRAPFNAMSNDMLRHAQEDGASKL